MRRDRRGTRPTASSSAGRAHARCSTSWSTAHAAQARRRHGATAPPSLWMASRPRAMRVAIDAGGRGLRAAAGPADAWSRSTSYDAVDRRPRATATASIKAPMHGKVLALLVEKGASVRKGPAPCHHRGDEDGAHADRAASHGTVDARSRSNAGAAGRRRRADPDDRSRNGIEPRRRTNRMPLHLIKLCVGCDSVEDLEGLDQRSALKQKKRGARSPSTSTPRAWCRSAPTNSLDGGSLYLGDPRRDPVPRAHPRRSARSSTRTASAAASSCWIRKVRAGAAAPVPRLPGLALSRSQGRAARSRPRRARRRHMPEPLRRELRELGLL